MILGRSHPTLCTQLGLPAEPRAGHSASLANHFVVVVVFTEGLPCQQAFYMDYGDLNSILPGHVERALPVQLFPQSRSPTILDYFLKYFYSCLFFFFFKVFSRQALSVL